MFDKNKMEIFKLNHKQSSRITSILPEIYQSLTDWSSNVVTIMYSDGWNHVNNSHCVLLIQ